MSQSILAPPCSQRAIPPAAERPVVVQCPYTLSSCPLFNPTFSTAEVLEAQAASTSASSQTLQSQSHSPPEPAPAPVTSIPRYGLAESMRKATTPPGGGTLELEDASPFQYIDFSIAPTGPPLANGNTPSWNYQSPGAAQQQEGSVQYAKAGAAASPSRQPLVSAAQLYGIDPPLGLVNGQAQQPQQAPIASTSVARAPRARSLSDTPTSPIDTAQTPRGLSSLLLDSFEPLNPAINTDSYSFSPPAGMGSNGAVHARRASAGHLSTNESSLQEPVGLGAPDLRVAYELAGMAYKSRNPQSPISNTNGVCPNGTASMPSGLAAVPLGSNGYPAPSSSSHSGMVAAPLYNDLRPSLSREMGSYESTAHSDQTASLPMTASTSASSTSSSTPAAVFAETEGRQHVTPFISKLNHLLSDSSYSDVIRWNHDGTVILYAHTSARLLEILGRFFRHTTVASFARQLNIYAFRRLGTSELLSQLEACRSLGVRGCASEWSGFTHELMWREGSGKPKCDLGRLKPSGPKTEKGKQNLAKKMAENGGSKKRKKKKGPEAATTAAVDTTGTASAGGEGMVLRA
ncbi:hypothetical protein JCM10908_006208 [Rhodotorula pacifica]|uniref:heat shock factor family protein n=1 Tax=Rhodotorula pacifica TaxID=1495444 RepID=UPI003180D8A9